MLPRSYWFRDHSDRLRFQSVVRKLLKIWWRASTSYPLLSALTGLAISVFVLWTIRVRTDLGCSKKLFKVSNNRQLIITEKLPRKILIIIVAIIDAFEVIVKRIMIPNTLQIRSWKWSTIQWDCYRKSSSSIDSVAFSNPTNWIFENYKERPSKCFWNEGNPLAERVFTAIWKSCQKALKVVSLLSKFMWPDWRNLSLKEHCTKS